MQTLRNRLARSYARAHRGMTLLEIMIVLAILALVMGLLVGPKVMKAFSSSKVDITKLKLKKSGQFPPTMIHMIAVGERAGQLEQMLDRVAIAYEAEIDTKLTRFIALLEPLMLLGMGLVVAFIVISILQPIMDLGSLGPK